MDNLHHTYVTNGSRAQRWRFTQVAPYDKLKVHLADDIVRFAAAPHTDSEKGEQCNKFTRDKMFHTNRQNISRDFMLRHISQGWVWTNNFNCIEDYGEGVKEFVESEVYKQYFISNDRELVDNNKLYYKKGVVGMAGIFNQGNGNESVLGKIAVKDKKENKVVVHAYEFVPNTSISGYQSQSIFETCYLDKTKNFIVRRAPHKDFALFLDQHENDNGETNSKKKTKSYAEEGLHSIEQLKTDLEGNGGSEEQRDDGYTVEDVKFIESLSKPGKNKKWKETFDKDKSKGPFKSYKSSDSLKSSYYHIKRRKTQKK
ncbi:hypothetical protein BD770DRAFT_405912 [Pilaira anomala]|nr:hypothetical protein BD770DRAFT_405912 [Pilaira anomala]